MTQSPDTPTVLYILYTIFTAFSVWFCITFTNLYSLLINYRETKQEAVQLWNSCALNSAWTTLLDMEFASQHSFLTDIPLLPST